MRSLSSGGRSDASNLLVDENVGVGVSARLASLHDRIFEINWGMLVSKTRRRRGRELTMWPDKATKQEGYHETTAQNHENRLRERLDRVGVDHIEDERAKYSS